jgi:hypothetical protein
MLSKLSGWRSSISNGRPDSLTDRRTLLSP